MDRSTSGPRVFGGSSAGPLLAIVVGLIVLAVIMVCAGGFSLFFWAAPGQRVPVTGPPGISPAPALGVPAVNPIDRELLSAPRGTPRDGIAIALVIDTTGSMQETVRDRDGSHHPKLEIARRCAADLVAQAQKAAVDKPERHIQLALYEFSSRGDGPSCRQLLPLAAPEAALAQRKLAQLGASGGTPIGQAILTAKKDLDASGFTRQHILVVTDGQSNQGYEPGDVAAALSRLPEGRRSALYLVAFDVGADNFKAIKQAGGTVLPASGGSELQQALDYLLTGKILAEEPMAPGKP